MGKLFQFKTLCLLLLAAVLVSAFIFPQDVFAWAAIKSKTIGTRDFWPPWKFLFLTHWDLDTHQMMLENAYTFLSKDPAFKEQPDVFPKKDDFMQWEGVIAESLVAGYRWGALGKGGPDASEQSRDAEHYYNPLIDRIAKDGNAPQSIERHFRTLLSQMYPPPGSEVKGAKDAAWAAHYLADIFVPFHVIGIPAEEILGKGDGASKHILTLEEAGGQILWRPKEFSLDTDGAVDKNSIVTPQHGWGRDMDFSKGIGYFNEYCAADNYKNLENSDWYDPWYHNGKYVPGTWNSRRATGSHASWEEWAHKYMVRNKLMTVPTEYLSGWENAKPDINLPFNAHLDNQAKQSVAFTIAQAKITRANLAKYLKEPQRAANPAIQAVATVWRASLSALKPQVRVEPIDPKGSNRYRVLGTVRNVADEDAINVQAKLKVEGGKIIDASSKTEGVQPVGTLNNKKPAEKTWEIETTKIDQCKIEMIVTGEFKLTKDTITGKSKQLPDLGYASIKAEKPGGIIVTLSPSQVELKKDIVLLESQKTVRITVQIDPPKKTALQIQKWEPLIVAPGPYYTEADGKFTQVFAVKEPSSDGKYEIKVTAPELGISGTATLQVGKPDKPFLSQFLYAEIKINSKGPICKYTQPSGKTQDSIGFSPTYSLKGSFNDNVFTSDNIRNPTLPQLSLTVAPTNDPNVYKIVNYSVRYNYQYSDGVVEESLTGKTPMDAVWDKSKNQFIARISGVNACQSVSYNSTSRYKNGGTSICKDFACAADSYIQITFCEFKFNNAHYSWK